MREAPAPSLFGRSSRAAGLIGDRAARILLWAVLALRATVFWPSGVEVLTDSTYYLQEPVSLVGEGNRSVLGGLFFQAFASDLHAAAVLQHLLACLAWGFLAWVCWGTLGRLTAAFVLLLSLSTAVGSWEDNILLESLLTSGIVVWVGLLANQLARSSLRLTRSSLRRGSVTALLWPAVTLCLHLLKPALFPFWGLLLLLQAALFAMHRRGLAVPSLVVLVCVVATGGPFARRQARAGTGWQAQTRGFSFQRHPEYRALEAEAGAPGCPSFEAAARSLNQGAAWFTAWGELPVRCPARRAWYDAGGLSLRQLAARPLALARMFVRDLHLVLLSPRDYFGAPTQSVLTRLVDGTVFAPPLRARLFPDHAQRAQEQRAVYSALALIAALSAGLGLLKSASARNARWRFDLTALLALAAFAAICLSALFGSWLVDGMDVERHGLIWNVPLRVVLLLCVPLCVQARVGAPSHA